MASTETARPTIVSIVVPGAGEYSLQAHIVADRAIGIHCKLIRILARSEDTVQTRQEIEPRTAWSGSCATSSR